MSKRTRNGSSKQGQTPIYSGSHVVGRVEAGVFHKSVSGSKHFLQKPPGIAFDVSSLNDAGKAGAVHVEVYDKETRTTYRATLAHVLEHGRTFNRGYGEQIVLTFEGWTKRTKGAPSQPGLFGGVA